MLDLESIVSISLIYLVETVFARNMSHFRFYTMDEQTALYLKVERFLKGLKTPTKKCESKNED